MKSSGLRFTLLLYFVLGTLIPAVAQQGVQKDEIGISLDLFSGFVWRGSRFGTGPHLQPSVVYTSGSLETGIWGSFDTRGYSEADAYIFYTLSSGIRLGLTDYYSPDLPLFGFSAPSGSHALELNAGFSGERLEIEADLIVNEAGGIGSSGGDFYFEALYSFRLFSLFAGAGNGWHTREGRFNICNLGLEAVKTIKVTETFSIPVTGQVVINPDKEQLFIVAGFSF